VVLKDWGDLLVCGVGQNEKEEVGLGKFQRDEASEFLTVKINSS